MDYFFNNNENNRYYEFSQDDLENIRLLRNNKYADKNWIYNTYPL